MDKVEDLKEMSQLWSENKDEEAYDKWEQGELEKIVLQHQKQHQQQHRGRGESGAAGEGIDVVVSRPRHDPEGVFNTFAAGITALTRETMEEGSALTAAPPVTPGPIADFLDLVLEHLDTDGARKKMNRFRLAAVFSAMEAGYLVYLKKDSKGALRAFENGLCV